MPKGYVKAGVVIGVVVGLILIANLLPIGVDELTSYNGSYTYESNGTTTTATNTTMATLVSEVIPIMGVIALALGFVAGVARKN